MSADAPPTGNPNRLVLLANPAMRARRRPLAIALVWAYEVFLALALTWPFSAFVSGAYGAHPQGDAPLWREGGLALADLVVRSQNVVPALSAHAMLILGLGVVLGLFPMGLLVVSIAYTTPALRSPPLRKVALIAVASLPALFALLVVMALVQGLFLLIGLLAAEGVASSASGMGEARAQQIGALVGVVFLIVAAVIGVTHDLSRTAVLRFEVGPLRALRLALNTLRAGPVTVVWSWGWRALVAWLPVAMGAFVAQRIGGRGGGALLALAAIHQLVILSRVALRASWLAKALRLVDHAHRVLRAAT